MVGASKTALALRLPTSAIDLKQGCWIVSGDHLYLDGNVVSTKFFIYCVDSIAICSCFHFLFIGVERLW